MSLEMIGARAAYEPAAYDEGPPAHEPYSWRERPPGFGRWPWWTPLCALAAGLVLLAGPFAAIRSTYFPMQTTTFELLATAFLFGPSLWLMNRFGGPPRPADLGLRSTYSRAAVGWVLLARIGFLIVAAMYVSAAGGVTPNIPIVPIGGATTVDAVDAVLAVCILAPVTEEIFFRGFMYGALRGPLGVVPATLVTGTVFGAIHTLYGGASWDLVPVLALAGMAMCLLYERTGSLWPAIAFHVVMNLVVVALVTGNIRLPLYLAGGAGLVFLVAPWRFFRRGPSSPARDAVWTTAPPPGAGA